MKSLDDDAIIGAGGYIYFGAARKLPGVQELVRPGEGSLPPQPQNFPRVSACSFRRFSTSIVHITPFYGFPFFNVRAFESSGSRKFVVLYLERAVVDFLHQRLDICEDT